MVRRRCISLRTLLCSHHACHGSTIMFECSTASLPVEDQEPFNGRAGSHREPQCISRAGRENKILTSCHRKKC